MLQLRNRDKNIINFIQNYGYLSIQQCADIFYKDHKMKYDESRKRLRQLYNNKLINRLIISNNKCIYIDLNDNRKKLNWHRYYLIQFYCLLIKYGAIKTFIKEYEFKDMGIRSDGFCELIYNNKLITMFIEIDYSHNTQIDRYDKLYEDGRIQDYYLKKYNQSIFPEVVIVKENIPKRITESDNYNIIYLDFSLSNFERVLN